jgi:tetratricopeptide (TPR) repeat protein
MIPFFFKTKHTFLNLLIIVMVILSPALSCADSDNVPSESKKGVENNRTAMDWYHIGIGYSELAMHKEAMKNFKQAIKIKPDLAEAHLGLGISYHYLKDRKSALKEYNILKDLDPQMAKKLFKLMHFYPRR